MCESALILSKRTALAAEDSRPENFTNKHIRGRMNDYAPGMREGFSGAFVCCYVGCVGGWRDILRRMCARYYNATAVDDNRRSSS